MDSVLIPALITAFLAAIVATSLTWLRVPVKMLQVRRDVLILLMVLVGLLAGTLHLLGFILMKFHWDPDEALALGRQVPLGAASLALALLVWRFRLVHLRDFARLRELGERLRPDHEPALRREALSAVREVLRKSSARWPRPAVRMRANLELFAAHQLIRANLWSEAEELLKSLPAQYMTADFRSAHAAGMTVCRIYQADKVGARAWFTQIPRPARDPKIEAIYRTIDGLFLVLEGRSQEALGIVGHDEEPLSEPTELERGREHVRAHALAALGDTDRARAILHRMSSRHSVAALERVAAIGGPASSLAQAILNDRDQPYR